MRTVQVTLLSKPGCHLCDTARETTLQVIERENTRHTNPTTQPTPHKHAHPKPGDQQPGTPQTHPAQRKLQNSKTLRALRNLDGLHSVFRVRTKHGPRIKFTEVNILEDAQLANKYAEDIPVLLIDGKRHAFWKIDPERLARALR